MTFGLSWGAIAGIAGGALSAIGSGGGQSQSSQGTSTQDVFLSDYFKRLFGNANAAANAFNTQGLFNTTSSLFGGGIGFLDTLQGQAAGTDASGQYLQSRLSGDNSIVNSQISALGTDLGNFYNQQLLPGISSDAIAGGQLGGGRQGVAQGLAATGVAQQFASGAANLRGADQAQRLQAALGLGTQTGSAAVAGLGSLQGLGSLAASGYASQFAPLLLLSQILGSPTILTQQQQSSRGSDGKNGGLAGLGSILTAFGSIGG